MKKPFAITLDPGSSLANKTGSWRTERVVSRNDIGTLSEDVLAPADSPPLLDLHDDRGDGHLGDRRGGQRFDVIICDLMMPQMTGMELHAELVLERDPAHVLLAGADAAQHGDALALQQPTIGQHAQHPAEDLAMRVQIDQPPGA